MSAVEKAVEIVGELVPPPEDDKKALRRWRLWISLASMVNALGLGVHIILACGFAAPFYSGFAEAGELQTLRNDIKQDRAAIIEASILDAKQKHCAAAPAVKPLYLSALLKLYSEYHKLTGVNYPELDCKDFSS